MKEVFHFGSGQWLARRPAKAGGDAVRFVPVAERAEVRLLVAIADADVLCHVLIGLVGFGAMPRRLGLPRCCRRWVRG